MRYRRHHGRDRELFVLIKGSLALGIAFIFLGPILYSERSPLKNVAEKIITWALILGGCIWIIKKIRNRPVHTTKNQIAKINSEKHGCKCYMDGLTDGEQEIAHILAEGLSYKDYFIFNNLTIPSDHNGSSQIDHLVVSKFGIFVIESKDYKGWIFGNKDQEQWTQSLPGRNNKFQFQNPIRQNWPHIMSLKLLMPSVPENAFQSIVVFTDSCEFKTDPIENVVHSEEIVGCVQKCTETKISEDNLHLILGKLSYVCQTADISHEQHLENLHISHPKNLSGQ